MWYTCPLLKETQAVSNALDVLFWWGRVADCARACKILVLWWGIKLVPHSLEAWSPSHWTARHFPTPYILNSASVSILVQVALFPWASVGWMIKNAGVMPNFTSDRVLPSRKTTDSHLDSRAFESPFLHNLLNTWQYQSFASLIC